VSELSDRGVCAALEQLLSMQKSDWGESKVGARVFALILALPPPLQDDDLEPLNVLQLCVRVVEECRRQRASLLLLPAAAHSSTGRLGEQGGMVASIARLDLLRAAAETVTCPEAASMGRGRKGRLKRLGQSCQALSPLTPPFECSKAWSHPTSPPSAVAACHVCAASGLVASLAAPPFVASPLPCVVFAV
jgi:hypothetical protein